MTAAAEPRAGLRDTAPYTSPQLDVPVRLNTNETPHALSPAFFDELADAVRDLPLNRYPDGEMRRLSDAMTRIRASSERAGAFG